ncbi:putative protease YoaZ [Nocardiopsis terrae]|uniref:Intracellular protease/amidase n=1 Tax=Nocardiopsis terrae TaxID=372655 RepID=A0ABR9HCG1_9ACTN|nr:DJ-1/PfpI family protein [Nocardiopsis terrae]MBE1456707.1 putative intracellular protease/amidase [Nocardiopsis terrae]GHC75465.1 putative protease YoaZ [Nocardiopsis terrae]
MDAEPRTPLHLAVYDQMADWQYGHAVAHVRAGIGPHGAGSRRVLTVGFTGAPVTTAGGLTVLPDLALPQLKPSASAMLVLPGAPEWDTSPEMMAPLASAAGIFLDAGIPVAAVGDATAGLAREGLLDHRDHTGTREKLLATGYAGAHRYRSEPAVTDTDLVTAGPTAAVEFAREVLARLDAHTSRTLDAWYRLHALHDRSARLTLADEG